MGVDTLKDVRTQRYPHCVLLFCVWRLISAYILYALRMQADTDCVLAFLRRWFQPCSGQERCSLVFRPCWPAVAVLRARWGRKPQSAREGALLGHTGPLLRNQVRESSSGISFLCSILQAKGQTAQPTVSYKKPPPWGRASRALVRRCRTAH